MPDDCFIYMKLRAALSLELLFTILFHGIYKALPIEHSEAVKHLQVTDSIMRVYIMNMCVCLYYCF